MMKPIAPAFFACLFSFILSGVMPAADPVRECGERLKRLGSACLLFARVNQGRMPASLSELCYAGYVTELKFYACPATRTEILLRKEIDAKSDYMLSPPVSGSGPTPVAQDRSAANHAGAGINVYYSDGSVRWQPSSGLAKPVTSASPPRAVAASRVSSPETVPKPGGLLELKTAVGQNIYLGMRSHAITPDEARSLNLSAKSGLVIDEIQSASYARAWNLMVGDVLTSAAGAKLVDNADLSRIIAAADPGMRLAISLLRQGISQQVSIDVGNLPQWLTNPDASAPPLTGSGGTIRSIRFGLGVDDSGNLVQPGNRFGQGSQQVSCLIDYSGFQKNSEILVEWRQGDSVMARSLGVLEGSGRLAGHLYVSRSKPLAPGLYSAYVTAGGRAEIRGSFEVR
jgi:hypothetical protein